MINMSFFEGFKVSELVFCEFINIMVNRSWVPTNCVITSDMVYAAKSFTSGIKESYAYGNIVEWVSNYIFKTIMSVI